MLSFFIHFIYLPIYNLLAYFVDVLPSGDLGLAVVATALSVRVIFLPLSLTAIRTQHAMRAIQPQLDALRKEYKDNPQEQSRRIFELYREHGVRPFSSMLMMFIQIPILLGLYSVVRDVVKYHLDPGLLYHFVSFPQTFSEMFLGLFPVAASSLVLAVAAGVVQLLYSIQSVPVPEKKGKGETEDVKEEFGRAMAIQMRYMIPVFIGFISYASGAVALYFTTTNLFMLVQGFFVKRAQEKAAALAVAKANAALGESAT
jgi:YidC/Oxa1 family membrane protein insertase